MQAAAASTATDDEEDDDDVGGNLLDIGKNKFLRDTVRYLFTDVAAAMLPLFCDAPFVLVDILNFLPMVNSLARRKKVEMLFRMRATYEEIENKKRT